METLLSFFNYVFLPLLKGERRAKQSQSLIPSFTDLKLLAATQDLRFMAAVGYAYDPVPCVPHYIRPSTLAFPQHASKVNDVICSNTIRLKPHVAGLPYRSSFDYVRATKHWRANLDETIKVLKPIAADTSTVDVEVGMGITLAKLAQMELRPGLENRMVIATSHMFPSGDERRIRIIAVLMIMYFVFDGKFEKALRNRRGSC